MSLSQVMAGIRVNGPLPEVEITGISHDSRRVIPGSLFVALPGLHVNGLQFVTQALNEGASVIAGPAPRPDPALANYVELEDPARAYSRMAANFYQHPSQHLSVIGITGTNGKTTTAEVIAAILRAHGTQTAILGTLGLRWEQHGKPTGYTTPEADQIQHIFSDLVKEQFQAVVMEVSSHALKQYRVDDVDFNAAVFTNFTQDHLDYHPDMTDYLESKLRLFRLLSADQPAVVNLDDPHAERFLEAVPGRVITFGLNPKADVRVMDFGLSLELTVANLAYQEKTFSIESKLIGEYNLENLLAAAAAALVLDIPIAAIQAGISAVHTVPGRLEQIRSAAPGMILIDYAHTPDAYTKLLSTLRQLASRQMEIITFFGCGGDRDRVKRPLMAAEAEAYSDQLIITSDNPRTESLKQINNDILEGLSQKKHTVINDRKEALRYALGSMTENTILVILGKGREDYEIVGTEKIYHNDVEIVETYQP